MDAALTVRPQMGSSQSGWQRSDSVAVRAAVRSAIAPSSPAVTVAQAEPADVPAGDSATDANTPDSNRSRQVIVDAATHEVIHRVVDEDTGSVIKQFPEETTLKLRAYSRALAEGTDVSSVSRKI